VGARAAPDAMSRPRAWAGRPLADDSRRWAFALAAGILALSAGALTLLPRQHATPAAGPRGTTHAIVLAAEPRPAPGAGATKTAPAPVPAPAFDAADGRAGLASAHAFLRAYLRYEVGAGGAAVGRALRRHATPAFAHDLLGDPPRRVAGHVPRPGRIDGLELGDGPRAPRMTVAASVDRGGTLTPLVLLLDRWGAQWRVSGLR
jgi:hypothetical protein